MRKFFLAVICLAALNSSCEKRTHCIHTYKDSKGVTHTIDLGKRYGEQQNIKTLEDSCSTIAQNVGGNCTCTSN
jgi:hypothetical protein